MGRGSDARSIIAALIFAGFVTTVLSSTAWRHRVPPATHAPQPRQKQPVGVPQRERVERIGRQEAEAPVAGGAPQHGDDRLISLRSRWSSATLSLSISRTCGRIASASSRYESGNAPAIWKTAIVAPPWISSASRIPPRIHRTRTARSARLMGRGLGGAHVRRAPRRGSRGPGPPPRRAHGRCGAHRGHGNRPCGPGPSG